MNRKLRITLASLGVTVACLGLTSLPAHADPVTRICNSIHSEGSYWPDTENFLEMHDKQYKPWLRGRLLPGQCGNYTNTSTLLVSLRGYNSWKVSTGSGYGQCHQTGLSNPANQRQYTYRGYYNSTCKP